MSDFGPMMSTSPYTLKCKATSSGKVSM
jgi:hypothetical protein